MDLDGVVLNVERHHTCYAPGDRVTVFAAVRSEFQTVILRGFEISLRESRTFRAGAYAQGKKTIPQTRVGNLTENKIPVNVTLMGGMIHKAELQLGIPPNHTTTTLNSARHIDITYVLCVRAIMGTGQPVVMELPVIMSNWPRFVVCSMSRLSSVLKAYTEMSRKRLFDALVPLLVSPCLRPVTPCILWNRRVLHPILSMAALHNMKLSDPQQIHLALCRLPKARSVTDPLGPLMNSASSAAAQPLAPLLTRAATHDVSQ